MSVRVPAEVFPPGEFIRDELETRGWTQGDLAFILGRPLQAVNEIIAGRKAITAETAKGLANAFGASAEMWMNLEAAYRLSRTDGDGDVARRAKLYELAPVKEMVKRRWIGETTGIAALEGELLRFFQLKDLEQEPELSFAAKMSAPYGALSPAHKAWFCRAKQLARAVGAAKFKPQALEQGLTDLRQLIASEQDTRRIPKVLAEMGVRLVIVEHLPKTRIDGAALWLDKEKRQPAVALSLRYDRIDSFWFTLAHEMMHIRHGDEWSVDDALVGKEAIPSTEKPDYEQRADREAAEFLVPGCEIEGFIARVRPQYSKNRIIQFANRIQVQPGIIVGQLQRRNEIGWDHSREMLVKVRAVLREAALSDGWGDAPTT
ncbi:MAG TPA: addiction module antidote protein, HigA family [Planctomycetales bacterium]|jgi:HTH-type transcriptional regulator/antitoxin HigA|nr:addiction module antidote protein, HigA family [Planctomycetales bacterium]